MMKTLEAKSERIATRVTAEQKALIVKAASMRGRTITEFMVESAQVAAEATVKQAHLIELDARNQSRFAKALLNPSSANDALQAVAKEYDQHSIQSK